MRSVLIFLLSLGSSSYAQSFINSGDFTKKIASDIVVVEFWSAWNASNEVAFLSKLSPKTYRVDIAKDGTLQAKHNVNVLPTLIIFDNGKEVYRFEAGIAFTLEASKSDVQGKIDEIQMLKF